MRVLFSQIKPVVASEEEEKVRLKQVNGLKTALRTEPIRFTFLLKGINVSLTSREFQIN